MHFLLCYEIKHSSALFFGWILAIVLLAMFIEMKEQQKDRLTLLHSRLQQEAEKIRKWRTATELELNQKEQKLKEAQLRIDKQQKLISDIQVRFSL